MITYEAQPASLVETLQTFSLGDAAQPLGFLGLLIVGSIACQALPGVFPSYPVLHLDISRYVRDALSPS